MLQQTAPTHIVVLDFDGTVTKLDISDELCNKFAPPEWRDVDKAWERGEISLGDAQKKIWRMVRAGRHDAVGHAKKIGVLRAGLDLLIDSVRRQPSLQLWLASGGFDFYIVPIMGERLGRFGRAYFHKAKFESKRIELEFQHAELACPTCALCKGKIVDLALATGAKVIFVGDGSSDRCVIDRHKELDAIYTITGSFLEKLCEEKKIPHVSTRSLDDVLERLPVASK